MNGARKTNYPNPCDSCKKPDGCSGGYGCQAWRIRYRYRQKQINAYGRKLMQGGSGETSVFVYPHPDETRRYLADGPCKACKAESVCDTPCPAYLRWWDARMQITRKKVGA